MGLWGVSRGHATTLSSYRMSDWLSLPYSDSLTHFSFFLCIPFLSPVTIQFLFCVFFCIDLPSFFQFYFLSCIHFPDKKNSFCECLKFNFAKNLPLISTVILVRNLYILNFLPSCSFALIYFFRTVLLQCFALTISWKHIPFKYKVLLIVFIINK